MSTVGPNEQIQIAPAVILKRSRNNEPVSQVLIHWVNLGPEDASREGLHIIK